MRNAIVFGTICWVALGATMGMARAESKPAQNLVQQLDHGWQFRQVAARRSRPRERLVAGHRSRRRSPGSAGQQGDPDPFYRDNESKLQWIENESWEYRLNFDVAPALAGSRQRGLVFDGLDAAAAGVYERRPACWPPTTCSACGACP